MDISTATLVRPHTIGLGYNARPAPGKTLVPAIRPTRYRGERGKWDVDLCITRTRHAHWGPYELRFHVGYVDPTGSCRRVHGGPIVPGPYAYAYGLGTTIARNPEQGSAAEARRQAAAGIEHHVEDGDLIQLGYELFRVRYVRGEWIDLDHAGSVI